MKVNILNFIIMINDIVLPVYFFNENWIVKEYNDI